jgi:hypothetical protein
MTWFITLSIIISTIILSSGLTVLTEASSMTWKDMFACIGMFRAAAFARSSTLVFLFLSMYYSVKPFK